MDKPDFVREFVALAQQTAPAIDHHAAARLEDALRLQFGGQVFRVSPLPKVTIEDIDDGLRLRLSVRDIAQSYGVSRATIYRRIHARKKN